jgi:zeaxanthin glucosyltransferase
MAEPAQAALTRILERHRHPKGGRTLIFAGFGSAFSTDLDFLRRLLGVVTPRPDWEIVISLGGRLAPADVGPLPERVHVFPWVPQVTVLQHADVAVTHGGINTVDECVLNGVPMLVYCGFETDMAGNTARVVHHGIGLAGDRRRDTTDRIRAHIDRLLQEPRFESALRDLRRWYVAYADERVAERTVETILDRRPRHALAHAGLSKGASREVS